MFAGIAMIMKMQPEWPKTVVDAFWHDMPGRAPRSDRERGWLYLYSCNGTLLDALIFCGEQDRLRLPLGDVLRRMVRHAPCLALMVHIHPSGDPRPSQRDVAATRRMWRMGRLVGVRLSDHVICADGDRFSFRDAGLL